MKSHIAKNHSITPATNRETQPMPHINRASPKENNRTKEKIFSGKKANIKLPLMNIQKRHISLNQLKVERKTALAENRWNLPWKRVLKAEQTTEKKAFPCAQNRWAKTTRSAKNKRNLKCPKAANTAGENCFARLRLTVEAAHKNTIGSNAQPLKKAWFEVARACFWQIVTWMKTSEKSSINRKTNDLLNSDLLLIYHFPIFDISS